MRRAKSLVVAALLLIFAPVKAEGPTIAPKNYTFEQALRRVIERNPSSLTAEQEVLRAEALVREARAASLPTLTGNATGSRIDHERSLGTRVVQGAQSLSANVQLAVPIIAPQHWAQWSHASDAAAVSRMSADDAKRTLLIAAARVYLTVIAQQRNLEVSEHALATAQSHYNYAYGRREGGVGNRLDEVRAEQEKETARAHFEAAQAALIKAQETLGVMLAEDGPVNAIPEVKLAEPPPLEAAVKNAADRRSDIKLLKSRADAAAQVRTDSYTDFLPTLTGQFQPFYQNPSTLTQPTTGWQAQLILTIPFYDGGQRYGARRERAALAAEAEINLEDALRRARSEVRAAFKAMRCADQELEAARNSAQLASEALELANQAYRAGATTNLEVIDAEQRARDAETAVAIAEDEARQARLDFLAASGAFP